jgi:hypothetical protein
MKNFKYQIYLILGITLFILFSGACSKKVPYDPVSYYSQEFIDSLMIDIVTYMGRKPKAADYVTRNDEIYRPYYIEHSREFYIDKLFIDNDGTNYYYIIRPARHPLGNRRAVGGKFRLDENMKLKDFQEIFVTQINNEENLKVLGNELFEIFISGEEKQFLTNREIIEWPDDRCQYDFEKKEWRYDVVP